MSISPVTGLPIGNNSLPTSQGAAAHHEEAAADGHGHHSSRRPRTVLVVDDEAGMCVMARAILEAVGFKADVAESGEEAIEKYRSRMVGGRPYGIVVMDLALPGGISGVEALGALREIDADVRVVASSGYLEANSREAALRTGFAGVLPKPYTADRLASVVKHALDG